jgi:hypothetical protein
VVELKKKNKNYLIRIHGLERETRRLNSDTKRVNFLKKLTGTIGGGNMKTFAKMGHLFNEDEKGIAMVNTDVSGKDPKEAVKTLSNELVFMTKLKDKFVKNLNDTRKRMIYAEEEAKKAVKKTAQIQEKLDDKSIELSDLLRDKEHLLEEVERLKRQHH